ncbi:excalibur calcium-binding domain-containing protein [Actinomyces oris]|jgi:excalibur|uniref:excalibur calcium-binding domain-containing protein n=1 Tax=Actinomyces oris TaxID=544580 RepID=UPI0028D0B059|nr:excalibur calcium-binding domain-containing protein [Actinomyces oris]
MNLPPSPPPSSAYSYGGPNYNSPTSRRRKNLRRFVSYVVTFVLGVGFGAAGTSDDVPAQSKAASVPTVVYSPTPVPTVVYSPSPVPTVVYSPSPVPATEAQAPLAAVPAAPTTEPTPETSEKDAGGGTSSGTGEEPTQSEADSSGVYYRNCKAARDAGVAPLYRGQSGYRRELDRDNDGIACE